MSTAAATASVGEALASAVPALAAAGVDTPRLDAELLLAEATGLNRASLAADPEAGVSPRAARAFGGMVRRRLAREPVAYILGRKGFRRIELEVDARVLIPRPETELLVEVADRLRPATVAEIGTGSGAVALAVADEIQEVEVVATDTSLDALAVAERNRSRLGFGERVRLVHGSIPPPGPYDLVLANLPYVGESEWPALQPEITRFEPRGALVGGPIGPESIEALLGAVALGRLATRAIALEVGATQAAMVGGLVRRIGFERVRAVADLAGIDRVVVGEGWRLGRA